jgi:hypothetical protein
MTCLSPSVSLKAKDQKYKIETKKLSRQAGGGGVADRALEFRVYD